MAPFDNRQPPPARRRGPDPSSYQVQGKFCAPCRRRVLPSEARDCKNDCAAKRMADE